MSELSSRLFENNFVSTLPGDQSRDSSSRLVKQATYSFVDPTPTKSSELMGWSEDLAQLFSFSRPSPTDLKVLSGNHVLPEMKPYAANYGGHQFGHWAGQLGDGRALNLGELKDTNGKPWEFQLKGAGRTPYSRGADGRAVLRSSLREFICSEAMFHLGVPTTRALSLVATGDSVIRDLFYDGHPRREPGAIVCRVAPSFLRFGNFEILASRNEPEILKKLVDYVLEMHFPKLTPGNEENYLEFFGEVCRRTAVMIVHWMRVGFVHGVMNTDNMSILGLTIDYGPYGWLDNYDPTWTPNTTDLPGRRYCYGQQPSIAYWNLQQLANALSVLFPNKEKDLQLGLDEFEKVFTEKFLEMMAKKLGLPTFASEDLSLLSQMDRLLRESEIDMTLFFRGLANFNKDETSEEKFLNLIEEISYQTKISSKLIQEWKIWFQNYSSEIKKENQDPLRRQQQMNQINPLYVPRNYLLQQAIEKAEAGDFSEIENLLNLFKNPYNTQEGKESYTNKRPEWAKDKPGCSTLSCSS